MTLSPSAPHGVGVIDLDAAGVLIHGALSLEGFSVDGLSVPAWCGEVETAGLGGVRVVDPESGWPVPGGDFSYARTHMNVSSFASQAEFSGTLTIVEDSKDHILELQLSFASVPGAGVVACPGERLFVDADGDGEVDGRDANVGGDALFGDAIDSDGRAPYSFCALEGQSQRGTANRSCARLDYRNDEPLRRRPGDCEVAHRGCLPAEFLDRSDPPATAKRFCMGYGVVDDGDGDGEPDETDACPATPPGSAIDGSGCSAAEFCSQQTVSACRRADFRNDEPLAKQPRDCARTKSKPRACTAATRS